MRTLLILPAVALGAAAASCSSGKSAVARSEAVSTIATATTLADSVRSEVVVSVDSPRVEIVYIDSTRRRVEFRAASLRAVTKAGRSVDMKTEASLSDASVDEIVEKESSAPWWRSLPWWLVPAAFAAGLLVRRQNS